MANKKSFGLFIFHALLLKNFISIAANTQFLTARFIKALDHKITALRTALSIRFIPADEGACRITCTAVKSPAFLAATLNDIATA